MKTLFIILIVMALIAGGILYFYDVRFVKYPTYDIMVISKKDPGLGYGIKYRKNLGIWSFGYNKKGDPIERRIWSN